MSLFIPYSRATILIPSGPASDPERYHLFIVINDPVPHSGEGEVLLVSVSTVKTQSYYDQTCLLSAGSHEFIKRDSFVDYGKARIETVQKLMDGVSQGKLIPKQPMDDEPFQRVCAGLFSSPHTKKKIRQFLGKLTG